MKKENLFEIEEGICLCRKKIEEFRPYIETDEAMATLYNQAIVDKAVLEYKKKNILNKENFIQKFGKVFDFRKKQKKICDYFMK